MMETKFRCKIGSIEFEYEGSNCFLKDDIPNVIEKMLASVKAHPEIEATASNGSSAAKTSGDSTNTIAGYMPGKTGGDLVIAACTHLTFAKGQEVSSRQDILNEMKEASTYYKTSYSANLSKTLDTLVKGKRLDLVSRNHYRLGLGERQKMGDMIAQHP